MSHKIILLFLLLSISFINCYDETTDEEKKFINAFGKLTAGKSKELITLVFSPSFGLKQKDSKYIQLSRGKIYKLKTNCIKTENNPFKIAVECEIDLSNISDGHQ